MTKKELKKLVKKHLFVLENKTSDKQENGNDFIADVSGSFLRIYKHTHRRQKHLASNSNFFATDVKIAFDEYSIYFTKPTIDCKGKTYKAKKDKGGVYHTAIVDEDEIINFGEFEFDADESNEDCLVVNYR
jgi:hypothetical protein